MKNTKMLRASGTSALLAGALLLLTSVAWGGNKEKQLYRFTESSDGGEPHAGVILDSAGTIYGTTFYGGAPGYGYGVVFKMTSNPDGSRTETILYSPTGLLDFPNSLTFGPSGNLYGTFCCGQFNGGVFLLTPNSDGSWAESDLYQFWAGSDGMFPSTGLTIDGSGNLYGTTYYGGNGGCDHNRGCGTVYELTPTEKGWSEKIIYRFTGGTDGSGPGGNIIGTTISGKLALDSSGSLYGTTPSGGRYGFGVAFKLTPQSDGSWTETVLHHFTGGGDGAAPLSQPIFDKAGNLYGTASSGGASGCGVLFKLAHLTGHGWRETVLHSFQNSPGCNPVGGLTFDTAGNLFGVTQNSNQGCYNYSCGTAYKLVNASGNGRTLRILHVFTGGTDGANVNGDLTLDSAGNVLGTTVLGGLGWGTVFEITQ